MNLGKNIDVTNSLNQGVKFLINNQHEDGSIHLTDETKWQVWETANAILSVYFANKDEKEFLKKATDFLLTYQREDGSFYYTVSFEENRYCMETTAISILALTRTQKDVTKGLEFILNKQNQDGSWDVGIPEISKYRNWPSITGFSLKTLLSMSITSDNVIKGVEFLLKNQLNDGSWGSKWIYYDTPYYPIHVILSVLKLTELTKSQNYQKAILFIKKNQNQDGSWENNKIDKPAPSPELRTALALRSLLVSPDKTDVSCIEKGVQWLIRRQRSDGHWEGGYFVGWSGKKEDIYATSTALYALKKFWQFTFD